MTNDATVASLGEFGLIDHCFKTLERTDVPGVGMGIGDDAAVFLVPRTQDLLATTDTLVEGVHFVRDADPRDLGWKAVAVNLSDIAAMGGEPRWYLLSITLPSSTPLAWVERLALGMNEAGARFRVTLAGGNTTRTDGPIVLTINMFGVVGHERSLLRAGAAAGNRLFVSGTIGDAALGLRHLLGVDETLRRMDPAAIRFLMERHLRPMPRTDLGLTLVDAAIARAVIDVSDGLLADAQHLCRSSGVGADIDLRRIPLSPPARQWLEGSEHDRWPLLLTGGEDYELLFAVAPGAADQLPAIAARLGVTLTEIGIVTDRKEVRLLDNGNPLSFAVPGFRHF
ncbi:MAG: thiamine-phosphate kinase [Magnetococcales bacterium]|nr:thiamine-phosphate kinase [Magnetococcales bacterium]